jgi:hypothetical protein
MAQFRFSCRAAALFVVLLSVEVLIARYVHDQWIRPFVGDVLAVAVVFYFLRSFICCKESSLAIGVLLFAWAVEIAQYFDFVAWIGFEDNKIARIVLGSTFDGFDMLAYAIGAVLVWLIETARNPVGEVG